MTYTALSVKQNKITLPSEWLKAMDSKELAASWLGDLIIIRPIPTVDYSLKAEKRVLHAWQEFKKEEREGKTKKLTGKLSGLLND